MQGPETTSPAAEGIIDRLRNFRERRRHEHKLDQVLGTFALALARPESDPIRTPRSSRTLLIGRVASSRL